MREIDRNCSRPAATSEVRGPIPTVRLLYNLISVASGGVDSNGPNAPVISGNWYVSNSRLTPQ